MRTTTSLFGLLAVAAVACGAGTTNPPAPPPPPAPGSVQPPPTGNHVIQDLGVIPSPLLGTSRRVRVYLPPGYDTGTGRYPVLYLHDGQGVFGSSTAFYMERTLTPLILSGAVRPVIVVAVDGKVDLKARDDEYRIVPPAKGQLYARMMVEEMVPRIDVTFRTLAGSATRAIGGASLGGIQAWYSGMTYPGTFGLVVDQSGVFIPQNGGFDHVAAAQAYPGKLPFKAYWDRGTNDGEASHQVNDQAMRTVLLNKGMVEGKDFKYLLIPGAVHSWSAWALRIDDFMTFMFPPVSAAPGQ